MKALIYDRTSINSAKRIEIYDELGNFYFDFPYIDEDERRLAISKAKGWVANLANFQPDQRELLSDGTTSPNTQNK